MIERKVLEEYLDRFLNVQGIHDYCPNGVQVEGAPKISKIVGGVTASQALIDKAVEQNADAILVHHGYFWKGENQVITGLKKARIKSLLENDINLFAYHLPVDVHPELGNNAELGRLLGFTTTGGLEPGNKNSVGLVGELKAPQLLGALVDNIGRVLNRPAMSIGDPDKLISTVAWCTGGAQGMIDKAVDLGVDAYLSGEISEPTVHIARETGVAYISAGHHATERYGIKALGEHLADKFDVAFEFVDIDNPV